MGCSPVLCRCRRTASNGRQAIRSSRRARRGAGCWLRTTIGVSGRTPISSGRIAWRRASAARRPLKARACPDGRPGGEGSPGHAQDCDEGGPPRWDAQRVTEERIKRRPVFMLHAGPGLSRRKVDVCLVSGAGEIVDEWASPPDADGLRGLAAGAAMHGGPVRGVIESMNGARFACTTSSGSTARADRRRDRGSRCSAASSGHGPPASTPGRP